MPVNNRRYIPIGLVCIEISHSLWPCEVSVQTTHCGTQLVSFTGMVSLRNTYHLLIWSEVHRISLCLQPREITMKSDLMRKNISFMGMVSYGNTHHLATAMCWWSRQDQARLPQDRALLPVLWERHSHLLMWRGAAWHHVLHTIPHTPTWIWFPEWLENSTEILGITPTHHSWTEL